MGRTAVIRPFGSCTVLWSILGEKLCNVSSWGALQSKGVLDLVLLFMSRGGDLGARRLSIGGDGCEDPRHWVMDS